jgi:hypothetical protein
LTLFAAVKHFVQYHNTEKQGRLRSRPDGRMAIFTSKPSSKLIGQRIWLVSGEGSPRRYKLENTFVADKVQESDINIVSGADGTRFDPPIPLSGLPWFADFLRSQQNFSLGLREIPLDVVAHLEAIAKAYKGAESPRHLAEAALQRVDALSVDAFVTALRTIEARMSDAQRAMLIGHAAAPGASLSMSAVAALAGYSSYKVANTQYGGLAGRLAEALGIGGLKQKMQVLAVPLRTGDDQGHWKWTLRPQFLDAVWQVWPDDLVRATPNVQWAASEVDADPASRNLSATERAALIQARMGQGAFRQSLMALWRGRCAVTGCSIEAVLVSSHAKPWCDSTNQERLDPYNGLLLAASVDRLFDRGLIAFADDGRMVVASSVTDQDLRALGISPEARLTGVRKRHLPYLAHHRRLHGFDD